jgi:hypothetical protein
MPVRVYKPALTADNWLLLVLQIPLTLLRVFNQVLPLIVCEERENHLLHRVFCIVRMQRY